MKVYVTSYKTIGSISLSRKDTLYLFNTCCQPEKLFLWWKCDGQKPTQDKSCRGATGCGKSGREVTMKGATEDNTKATLRRTVKYWRHSKKMSWRDE